MLQAFMIVASALELPQVLGRWFGSLGSEADVLCDIDLRKWHRCSRYGGNPVRLTLVIALEKSACWSRINTFAAY